MKNKTLFFIFLFLTAFLGGCVASRPQPIDLSPSEFKEIIEDDAVFVIDVHIPEQEHIKGTDAVIPFDVIGSNLDKLPKDKNKPIALYCRSGGMSVQASQDLIDLGYTKVYNLLGGAKAWRSEGFEFEDR